MTQDSITEKHSIGKSLILHLFPGGLIGLCYFLLVQPFHRLGYPSMMALMVSVALVLVPFELGCLLYLGYKKNGKLSLDGIVYYRNPIPVRQYLIWVPVVFIIVGLTFTLLKPVDGFLQKNLFAWMPNMESGLQGGFSKNSLIVTYVMVAVFGAVVGPIVEEFYFRGFLLPRMKFAGKAAPFLHSFLFALYHVFTPWMVITRTIGMLPMIYAAKKRNLYVTMIVHVMVNLIDVIVGVGFILSMAGNA